MESELLNEKHRRITSITPHNYLSFPIALALFDNNPAPTESSHSIDPLRATSLFVVTAASSKITVINNQSQQPLHSRGGSRLTEIAKHQIETPYTNIHAICISSRLVYIVDMDTTEISVFSLEGDYVVSFYRQRPNSHFITDLALSRGGETAYLTDHHNNLIRIISSCSPLSTTAGEGVLLNPDRISTTASGAVVALCRNGLYVFNETRYGLVFIRQLYRIEAYAFSGDMQVYAWACFCCDATQELIYLATPTHLLTLDLEGHTLSTLHLEKESQYLAYNVDVKVNQCGRIFFLNSYHNSIVTY